MIRKCYYILTTWRRSPSIYSAVLPELSNVLFKGQIHSVGGQWNSEQLSEKHCCPGALCGVFLSEYTLRFFLCVIKLFFFFLFFLFLFFITRWVSVLVLEWHNVSYTLVFLTLTTLISVISSSSIQKSFQQKKKKKLLDCKNTTVHNLMSTKHRHKSTDRGAFNCWRARDLSQAFISADMQTEYWT